MKTTPILIILFCYLNTQSESITGYKGFNFGMSPEEVIAHGKTLNLTMTKYNSGSGFSQKETMMQFHLMDSLNNSDSKIYMFMRRFNLTKAERNSPYLITKTIKCTEALYQIPFSIIGNTYMVTEKIGVMATNEKPTLNFFFTDDKLRLINKAIDNKKLKFPQVFEVFNEKYGKGTFMDDGCQIINSDAPEHKTVRYQFSTKDGKASIVLGVKRDNRAIKKALKQMKKGQEINEGNLPDDVYSEAEELLKKKMKKKHLMWVGYFDSKLQEEMNVNWEKAVNEHKNQQAKSDEADKNKLKNEF